MLRTRDFDIFSRCRSRFERVDVHADIAEFFFRVCNDLSFTERDPYGDVFGFRAQQVAFVHAVHRGDRGEDGVLTHEERVPCFFIRRVRFAHVLFLFLVRVVVRVVLVVVIFPVVVVY